MDSVLEFSFFEDSSWPGTWHIFFAKTNRTNPRSIGPTATEALLTSEIGAKKAGGPAVQFDLTEGRKGESREPGGGTGFWVTG